MSDVKLPLLLVIAIALNAAVCASAAQPAASAPEKHCLGLMQIDHIDIVDNSHIVFATRNGDSYINELPHACPTLDTHKAIMYQTPLNSLCDLDIITVLDYVGGGFQSTVSCGLGKFKPATGAEIEALKKPAK